MDHHHLLLIGEILQDIDKDDKFTRLDQEYATFDLINGKNNEIYCCLSTYISHHLMLEEKKRLENHSD